MRLLNWLVAWLVIGMIVMSPDIAAAHHCRSQAAPGVDWRDCKKRTLVLKGIDLGGANLAGVDFTKSDLSKANLLLANSRGGNSCQKSARKVECRRRKFQAGRGVQSRLQRNGCQGRDLCQCRVAACRIWQCKSDRCRFFQSRACTITVQGRAPFGKSVQTGEPCQGRLSRGEDCRFERFRGCVFLPDADWRRGPRFGNGLGAVATRYGMRR